MSSRAPPSRISKQPWKARVVHRITLRPAVRHYSVHHTYFVRGIHRRNRTESDEKRGHLFRPRRLGLASSTIGRTCAVIHLPHHLMVTLDNSRPSDRIVGRRKTLRVPHLVLTPSSATYGPLQLPPKLYRGLGPMVGLPHSDRWC